jgi:hypothetical protein
VPASAVRSASTLIIASSSRFVNHVISSLGMHEAGSGSDVSSTRPFKCMVNDRDDFNKGD